MTTIDAYDTWQRFRLAHPHSREPFVDTPGNRLRWEYHLREVQKNKQNTTSRMVLRPIPNARMGNVWKSRAPASFEKMDVQTQQRYGMIYDCFPGIQIFACGSRVNGDYVDTWSEPHIREMRRALGKADKDESDFDFWVPSNISPVSILPTFADRLFYLPAGERKIPVPMWDFSKLPEHEHAGAIDATKNARVGALILLHDRYQLSPYSYCGCAGDEQAVLRHFRAAIDGGKIKDNGTENSNGSGRQN